jgi:hypothetical protein
MRFVKKPSPMAANGAQRAPDCWCLAPGHKAFVPSMIGGACQADVGILVISARKVLPTNISAGVVGGEGEGAGSRGSPGQIPQVPQV